MQGVHFPRSPWPFQASFCFFYSMSPKDINPTRSFFHPGLAQISEHPLRLAPEAWFAWSWDLSIVTGTASKNQENNWENRTASCNNCSKAQKSYFAWLQSFTTTNKTFNSLCNCAKMHTQRSWQSQYCLAIVRQPQKQTEGATPTLWLLTQHYLKKEYNDMVPFISCIKKHGALRMTMYLSRI